MRRKLEALLDEIRAHIGGNPDSDADADRICRRVVNLFGESAQSQQAEIERLQECLKEIIDEKRLHGQVVDGIVKARRLLPTDRGVE